MFDTNSAGAWEQMELLVTVKAYPSVSMKYGEAVCVAGVRLDTPTPEWARLFPVAFRDLPPEQQFGKYDVITLKAQKHSTDRRAESYRPLLESIQRGQNLASGGHWPARRRWVEPLLGPTMCELNRGRKSGRGGPSLAVVRPKRVLDVVVRDAEPWSLGQVSTLNQVNLLSTKTTLEKPAHAFSYHWLCEEPGCRGHTQSIADWELGEAYRSWAGRATTSSRRCERSGWTSSAPSTARRCSSSATSTGTPARFSSSAPSIPSTARTFAS
jgi:hypothetical protein